MSLTSILTLSFKKKCTSERNTTEPTLVGHCDRWSWNHRCCKCGREGKAGRALCAIRRWPWIDPLSAEVRKTMTRYGYLDKFLS
jgi:hypothetical protein